MAVAKYVDHLPLYRQEAIYARRGVPLSRSTLAEWIGAVGVALQPLVDATGQALLSCPVLHADQTPVAQLEPGRGQTRRAYVFAYRSDSERPLIVFDYCASRSGVHAQRFLGDVAFSKLRRPHRALLYAAAALPTALAYALHRPGTPGTETAFAWQR